jgi:hypothetical protein
VNHCGHSPCLALGRPTQHIHAETRQTADRLEAHRMERRQSSTGQVDRKEFRIDLVESRQSSTTGKVERGDETASTDRMERRNETVQY